MNGLLRHGILLLWRKDIMKSVFWPWQTTLRAEKYSAVTSLSYGAAGTVVIFMKDWRHLKNVLPVCGLPGILNFWLRTGKGFEIASRYLKAAFNIEDVATELSVGL
jgi:hypothetical protein